MRNVFFAQRQDEWFKIIVIYLNTIFRSFLQFMIGMEINIHGFLFIFSWSKDRLESVDKKKKTGICCSRKTSHVTYRKIHVKKMYTSAIHKHQDKEHNGCNVGMLYLHSLHHMSITILRLRHRYFLVFNTFLQN